MIQVLEKLDLTVLFSIQTPEKWFLYINIKFFVVNFHQSHFEIRCKTIQTDQTAWLSYQQGLRTATVAREFCGRPPPTFLCFKLFPARRNPQREGDYLYLCSMSVLLIQLWHVNFKSSPARRNPQRESYFLYFIYVRCPRLCVTCQLQICLDLDHGEFIMEETKGFIDKMNHECGKVSNEVTLPHHLVFAGKNRERKKETKTFDFKCVFFRLYF